MLRKLRSLLRVLNSRRDFENGMSEELRFHIEQYTEDLVSSGIPPREAARRARIEFGGMDRVEEECRQARGLRLFDELAREFRYAARLLRKTPGFTATAILTLAICIGANLTIFGVVDSILLRPLPFPDAGRLVTVFNTYPKAGVERDGSSITNYYERRGRIAAFDSIAMYHPDSVIAGETGATERVPSLNVTPDYFATLGIGPAMGRSFTDAETSFQTNKVAILSDAFWRSHFQADPHVVGRQVRINGVADTVIGVLPPEFRFLSTGAQLYLPLASPLEARGPRERHSGGNSRHMIARLKPGATPAEAQSQVDAQNAALEVDDPKAKLMADAGFRSIVASLHGDHVAAVRPALLCMQAGALALLLMGAVNLINLLLIRANGRVKEVALRQALGASRAHVVSEVVVETTLLTAVGGLLGIPAAAAGIRLLAALAADRLPLGSQIAFDTRLAGAALLGMILLGVVLAVPVAWFSLRSRLGQAIQSESRSSTGNRAAQRLRHAFIVAQIALAVVLLSSAGLLGLSLERAMAVAPGFRADRVLTGEMSIPWSRYPDWRTRLAFNERLLTAIAQQPGILSAGIVNNVPLSGNSGKSAATVKGHAIRPGEAPRGHYSYGVDGDYFTAMGFTLLEGRFLTAEDSRDTGRSCVVDEDFARYYWPGRSALGQRLFQGATEGKDAEAFTVVGVVGAVKQAGVMDESAQGAVYYPYPARDEGRFFIAVRTSFPPERAGAMLQAIVRQADPELPVSGVRPMETRIGDSLMVNRSAALLASLFSAVAVLLSAIGAYGVLSYAVAQRRREIGVRMALGARPEQIRRDYLLLALRLLAGGTVLGIFGARLAGEAIRALLFHVPPLHLAILAGAAGILAVASLGACLAPSLRAARVSPMEALAER